MNYTGAQIVIEELISHGVDTIFGYPGGAVLPIYDELYINSQRITHILTAHEQGASHAADGYARASGKTGVVVATSGPGATNLVTGIATAYLDSVPLVAITGNVATPLLGKDSFQEVDTIGITMPVVKHSFLVTDVKDLAHVMRLAFHIAGSGRKGPVLIDLPKDVQTDSTYYQKSSPLPLESGKEDSLHSIQIAAKIINASKAPFIYFGGGAVSADAGAEIQALSQKIHAPMGSSLMGVGAVPHGTPLYMGLTGMHGKYAANMLKSEADLIIAVGARFSDRATGNKDAYTKNTEIIHIDIDRAEFHKNIPADYIICGNIKKALQNLVELTEKKHTKNWVKRIESFVGKQREIDQISEDFSPKNIIRTVHRSCTPNTCVATDVGQHQMWVVQHYPFAKPRTLLTSGGLGTMGYGMGAAMGACIATGRTKTVLFTGDGSFRMNLNELSTASMEKLPLIIVILNNGVLGMVRQWQTMFFDRRYSATNLGDIIDFVKLAEAMGAQGVKVETLEALQTALDRYDANSGSLVIDCRMHRDEKVFPIIPPGQGVANMIVE